MSLIYILLGILILPFIFRAFFSIQGRIGIGIKEVLAILISCFLFLLITILLPHIWEKYQFESLGFILLGEFGVIVGGFLLLLLAIGVGTASMRLFGLENNNFAKGLVGWSVLLGTISVLLSRS